MKAVGIEKLNIYGCSLYLSQAELAVARDKDPEMLQRNYLIRNRSLNPLYEDVVTMAANAAAPMLNPEDKEQIGLLIFGTESGVDFSKPASTYILDALGLPQTARNFEVKHACYSGVASLECALDWICSGAHRGKKALVLASDLSRKHLNREMEMIAGGGAAAVLVSDTPKVIAYERGKIGLWTAHLYDFYRPDARIELVDNELSLFSYFEALSGAFQQYLDNTDSPVDLESYFRYIIYHMPFPGLALQAHRSLMDREKKSGQQEILASFNDKVLPSLRYATEVGSTYSASNFIGLCGLIDSAGKRLCPGERIGFFSYGSGAIGQFYSGIVLPEAAETVASMKIDEGMAARRKVSVGEYERIENLRDKVASASAYDPPLDIPCGWYDTHYRGRQHLILQRVLDYRREYGWS